MRRFDTEELRDTDRSLRLSYLHHNVQGRCVNVETKSPDMVVRASTQDWNNGSRGV